MTSPAPRTYPSKIDAWLIVVIAVADLGALAACAVLLAAPVPNGWMVALPLALITIGIPTWICTTTRYWFQESDLVIGCGPFVWKVPLGQITSILSTRNPLSSPALSLDRIRIEYAAGKSIMVSPRESQEFLAELRSRTRIPNKQ